MLASSSSSSSSSRGAAAWRRSCCTQPSPRLQTAAAAAPAPASLATRPARHRPAAQPACSARSAAAASTFGTGACSSTAQASSRPLPLARPAAEAVTLEPPALPCPVSDLFYFFLSVPVQPPIPSAPHNLHKTWCPTLRRTPSVPCPHARLHPSLPVRRLVEPPALTHPPHCTASLLPFFHPSVTCPLRLNALRLATCTSLPIPSGSLKLSAPPPPLRRLCAPEE